jgi:hypothetical protein
MNEPRYMLAPLLCPWECHLIGGPWIEENPECPFHGPTVSDWTDLTQDEADQIVAQKMQENEDA